MSRSNPNGSTNTETKQATTWLLPDQVERIRDVIYSEEVPTDLQDRDDALVSLLYDLGLRRSEAAALDVEDVNLDNGTAYLSSEIQKGSNPPPATLELGKWGFDAFRTLRRYLTRRWKETEALFPSRQSDRMTGRTVNNRVKTLAKFAEVKPRLASGGRGDPSDVSAHTLRHSLAYRIIQEEGGRLEDVQLRLRHSTRLVTDRIYSHLIPR